MMALSVMALLAQAHLRMAGDESLAEGRHGHMLKQEGADSPFKSMVIPANKSHVRINIGPNDSPLDTDKDGFLILVEPLPRVAKNLKAKYPSAADAIVFQMAISNFTGKQKFHAYGSNGGQSSS